jgi:hypothetical protein
MNVNRWVRRLVPFLEDGTHGHTGILSSKLEGTFDSLGRQPAKERTELLIIRGRRVYKTRRGGDRSIMDMETSAVGIIDNTIQPVSNVIRPWLSKGIMEHRDIKSGEVKLMVLHKDTVVVIAKFIEQVGKGAFLKVGDSIKPVDIIIEAVIKDGRVPVGIACPDNMWEAVPFGISVRTHVDIRKAVDNVDRKDIPIKRGDALQATLDLDRTVINIIAVGLQLR